MMHYSFDPAEYALGQSPLGDEEMLPLLNCILQTIDLNLRSLAISALTAGYQDPEKMIALKTLMGPDERFYLIVLFSTFAGIKPEITKKICDKTPRSKYKDSKLMAPINDLMGALYKNSSLSSEEKERFLGLIFQPPIKGERESKPDFNQRLELYRKNRQNWIAAVHSLLAFRQEEISKKCRQYHRTL